MKKEMTAIAVAHVAAALESLDVRCRVPFGIARGIHSLRKVFVEHRAIIADEEKKLIEKYHGTFANGNPRFTSREDADGFAMEHSKLMAEVDEVEFTPVDLSPYIDFIECSMDAIDTLDGIIAFETGGDTA